MSLADQSLGEVVQFLKIVGSIVDIAPVEAKPFYIFSDGIHVLHVLFHRIGIVEAQVADAPVSLSYPEVYADSFGMADMEIAVGFRRETCLDSTVILPFGQV